MSLLLSIARYVSIFIGSFIYLFGFSGSLLNIYMLFPNRHNPCTFLSIYSSIVDCFVLNIGLLFRILAVGFNIDFTLSNLVWCKIRTYGLRITTLISLYTICLLSVDRFLISCRAARWRKLCTIYFTYFTTVITTLLIAIEGFPFLTLTEIIRTNTTVTCTPMYNLVFAKYAAYFSIPILFGILPISIMIIMSLLIYFNLNDRVHLRRIQRSLTLITLFRILLALISCIPYTSYFVYTAIIFTNVQYKSAETVMIESFILSIISITLYITYSSSFFVHLFVSSKFRKQLKALIECSQCRQRNVIYPAPIELQHSIQNTKQNIIRHQKNHETV